MPAMMTSKVSFFCFFGGFGCLHDVHDVDMDIGTTIVIKAASLTVMLLSV